MKKIILAFSFFSFSFLVQAQDTAVHKLSDTLMLDNIEVTSIRAADKAPFTKTNISEQQIEKINLGQDLPFILNQTPSVVVNSDAGNGVGYTGLHILSLIHISEPTRRTPISYAVFCLKKKKKIK